MATYHFKDEDTERMVNGLIKEISASDITANFDLLSHTVTIEPKKSKYMQVKKIKRQLSKAHRKIVWKKFCGWYGRKGYWMCTLLFTVVFILLGDDWRMRLYSAFAIPIAIISSLIADEKQ